MSVSKRVHNLKLSWCSRVCVSYVDVLQVQDVTQTIRSYVEAFDIETGLFKPSGLIFGNTYFPDMAYIMQALLPEVYAACLLRCTLIVGVKFATKFVFNESE